MGMHNTAATTAPSSGASSQGSIGDPPSTQANVHSFVGGNHIATSTPNIATTASLATLLQSTAAKANASAMDVGQTPPSKRRKKATAPTPPPTPKKESLNKSYYPIPRPQPKVQHNLMELLNVQAPHLPPLPAIGSLPPLPPLPLPLTPIGMDPFMEHMAPLQLQGNPLSMVQGATGTQGASQIEEQNSGVTSITHNMLAEPGTNDIESRSETIPTTIHGEARGETTHMLIGDNNDERDVETAMVRATAIQGMEQLTSITQGASQRKDETSAITSIGHNSQPMAKGDTGNQAVNSEKEIDPQLTTSAANTALNEGEAVAFVTQHTPLGPKGDNQQVC